MKKVGRYINTLKGVLFFSLALTPFAAYADVDPSLTPEDFSDPAAPFFVRLLRIIFTPRYFEPHWEHFVFDPGLMWVLVVANVLTFIAYIIIPLGLIYFVFKRKEIFASRVFWLFGFFIILCGGHHIIHVITFWYPIYYLQGLVDILMAIVSIATAVVLFPVLRVAITLKSPDELATMNAKLMEEIDARNVTQNKLKEAKAMLQKQARDLKKVNVALEEKIAERTKQLKQSNISLEQSVQERTKELEAKVKELEEMNKVMIDREIRMTELKDKLAGKSEKKE